MEKNCYNCKRGSKLCVLSGVQCTEETVDAYWINKEQEQVMGSCYICSIYNKCNYLVAIRHHGGCFASDFCNIKHSCFEPRKQEEKKTTWFIQTIYNPKTCRVEKVMSKEEQMVEGGDYAILSTKQIDTSETDIKKIWEALNK